MTGNPFPAAQKVSRRPGTLSRWLRRFPGDRESFPGSVETRPEPEALRPGGLFLMESEKCLGFHQGIQKVDEVVALHLREIFEDGQESPQAAVRRRLALASRE